MIVRDRLAIWWEAVRDRLEDLWEGVRDRREAWWEEAVLYRIGRLRDSWQERVGSGADAPLDRWDRVGRPSLPTAPAGLAVAVVLSTALCGTALAAVLMPGGVGGSARPAPAASSPGPFLQRLSTVAERLAADRALQRRHLADERTARGQAAAAAALSGAYLRAASALEPAGRRGNPVVRALRVAAAAYASLERASSAGARRRFSSARKRIQVAEDRLRRALHGAETGQT